MPISKENYVHIENGKFARNKYTKADLENLFLTFQKHKNKDLLVVHFHGGLVSQQKGLEIVDRLKHECYESAGAYPVFFIWESHPWETVTNNLGEIFQEVTFKRLKKHLAQFALAKLKERPGKRGQRLQLPSDSEVWEELDLVTQGQIPYSTIDPHCLAPTETLSQEQAKQFEEQLEQDYRLTDEAKKIIAGLLPSATTKARGAQVLGSTTTLMSEDVLTDIRKAAIDPSARGPAMAIRIIKGAVVILAKVIKRFDQHRDHGFYPTIAEELLREFYVANAGKLVWDIMKKDIADSFKGYGRRRPHEYGGTAFLEELKKGWLNGHKPRIVLVGHSAGAIYICQWLKAVETQGLPDDMKFDVLFLAPACTFDLLAATLRKYTSRIANIRTFGMKDKLEQEDKLLGPFYPLSLLYLVSAILETEVDEPLIGMERFYSGEWPFDPTSDENLKEVLDYLLTDPKQRVWSKEDKGPGLASNAVKHGDFDNDPDTLKSIKVILQQGF